VDLLRQYEKTWEIENGFDVGDRFAQRETARNTCVLRSFFVACDSSTGDIGPGY